MDGRVIDRAVGMRDDRRPAAVRDMIRAASQRFSRRVAGLAALCLLTGCAAVLRPKSEFVPNTPPQAFDDSDWATVLRENVKTGLVDYNHLSAHRAALDRFVALISVVGPDSTPDLFSSPEAELAYWINAYNALVLYAVLEVYPTPTVYDLTMPRIEHDYRFVVDRKTVTLFDLEKRMDTVETTSPFAALALCRAARGSPPLASEPYRAATLDSQLDAQLRRIVENDAYVRVDHADMKLLLGVDLLAVKERLIEYHRQRTQGGGGTILSALLTVVPSAERRRELNRAVGYRIGTIPFDRRLNYWGALPDRTSPAPQTASSVLSG